MKDLPKVILVPLITILSYLINDDPYPDKEFMKLSFFGRMKYYYDQLREK